MSESELQVWRVRASAGEADGNRLLANERRMPSGRLDSIALPANQILNPARLRSDPR